MEPLVYDFLHSRIFITHVSGLFAAIASGYAVPNSPVLSLAVALITGITQAAHAYSKVKAAEQVTSADLSSVIVPTQLMNAAGTAPIEAPHTTGPSA